MKLRLLEHLESYLSAELKRRKRELSEMRGAVKRNQNAAHKPMVRAAVMLLYSHWEGFVRDAAAAYVNYVSYQGLPQKGLASNFLAICFRERLRECGIIRPSHHNAVVSQLRSDLSNVVSVPQSVIDTKDNLRGDVFREVVALLGLDYQPYASRENFISYTLCDKRNEIAHGHWCDVSAADYDTMHDEVIWLMSAFCDDILNAASTARYAG